MKVNSDKINWRSLLIVLFTITLIWSNLPTQEEKLLFEKVEQEIIDKKSWFFAELADIEKFLNYSKGDINYIDKSSLFLGGYNSSEFDKVKLEKLYDYLVAKGWNDITGKISSDIYIMQTLNSSENVVANTLILCKNKATIFMYMTDLQGTDSLTDKTIRTHIDLRYDYTLPCYEIEKYQLSDKIINSTEEKNNE